MTKTQKPLVLGYLAAYKKMTYKLVKLNAKAAIKAKSGSILAVVLIVIGVIILGGVGYWFWSKKKDE